MLEHIISIRMQKNYSWTSHVKRHAWILPSPLSQRLCPKHSCFWFLLLGDIKSLCRSLLVELDFYVLDTSKSLQTMKWKDKHTLLNIKCHSRAGRESIHTFHSFIRGSLCLPVSHVDATDNSWTWIKRTKLLGNKKMWGCFVSLEFGLTHLIFNLTLKRNKRC